jgi:hypothetical protein
MTAETARTKAWQGVSLSRSWMPLAAYSLAALAAFISQQYAVQKSLAIPGAVVNVKSIVMLHLPVLVVLGLLVFRERPRPLTLAASLSAIALAFLLVRSLI